MTDKAVEFLLKIYPNDPWCLSAATPDRDKIETRTFTSADDAKRWINAWNGERNLYVHANPPRDKNARKRLSRVEVAALHYLHVDIDPAKGEAADEACRARLLGLLTKSLPAGIPGPTAIVFSGGGFQAWWRLTEPLSLDGTLEAADNAKLWNVYLEQQFKGDHCHSIDHLLRLPGTWNIPGEQKKAKGRERVMAELVSFKDQNVYPITDFKKASPKQEPLKKQEDGPSAQIQDMSELDKWKVPARLKTIVALGHDPENPKTSGDTSRSAWLFDAVCGLIRYSVPDNVIYALITDSGWKISASVVDKKDRIEAYANKQIRDGHKFVGEERRGNALDPSDESSDSEFSRNDKGVIYCNQHNICIGLKKLGVALSYDLFAERQLIAGLSNYGPTLQDEALIRMRMEFETRFKFRPVKEYFAEVVEDQCRLNSFHPVVDYLADLVWDGKPRVDTWLIQYAGAQDSEYTRAVSRLMLLGAVRRVRQPGCEFHEMCVLISPTQGTGKSGALKALCPNEAWFTDDMPLTADSQKTIERLAGKWIVECAELKGMRNSDIEHLKAFLSRAIENARMAYGRISKEFRRQNVFFGTTNSVRFLRDSTGNRRFWPILIGILDRLGILRDRDQLWAEASAREANGESIRLEERLWGAAGEQQEEHRMDDPLYEQLVSALGEPDDQEAVFGTICSSGIWEILSIPVERRIAHTANMGEAMRKLGFERERKVVPGSGKREFVYRRGEDRDLEVSRNTLGQIFVGVPHPSARTF